MNAARGYSFTPRGFKTVKKSEDIVDDPFFRKLAWKSVGGFVLMALVVLGLGFFLREPVSELGILAIDALGMVGVFLGVLASDGFGFPVPPTTYLFAAVTAESPVVVLLIVSSVASILGGTIAYLIGPHIAKLPLLSGVLDRFRPRGELLFQRWGVWTVGIAAITPLPFPLVCWLAGIYRMPFGRFFPTILVRAPRLLAYYGIFALGWAGAAAI